MKSLLYATILLAVILGSVMLLRTIDTPPPPQSEPSRDEIPALGAAPSEPTPGVPSPDDTVSTQQLLATGERLLATWHPREATRWFERLVSVDSTYHEGWARLVECYSHPLVGREDAARAAWRRARATVRAPGDTVAVDALRDLYIEADYESAVGAFTAAARANAGPRTDYHLALSAYLAGRLDDAGARAERLLAADPANGRAAALGVRVMVARGDLDRASKLGRDLARVRANEPYPYTLLAQVELLRDEGNAAVEFCNNALLLDPRYIPAILTRAAIYAWAGEPEPARVTYEKLLLFDDTVLQGIGQAGIAFVDFHQGEFGRGMDAMDEAIRHAIMAGAVRRGLSYASRLVGYLCELGQDERAEEVVQRWITGFGDVPVALGSLRLQILRGDIESARRSLVSVGADPEWLKWARVLSLDPIELMALTHVAAGDYDEALALLGGEDTTPAVGAGVGARRAFVRGYAAFENGDAEAAATAFVSTRTHLYSVEFPYYGDPVLDVQALFFLAESALAAGAEPDARAGYREFLDYWGDASWDLPAVARAREKLAGPEDQP